VVPAGATRLQLRAAAELEVRRLEALERRYTTDPWAWMAEQVDTVDPATQEIRPWPTDKAYVRDLVEVLRHEGKVAIPKSRQVMATWTVAMWCLWCARHQPYHLVMWHSKDEESAAAVLDSRIYQVETKLREPALRRDARAHRTSSGLVGRLQLTVPAMGERQLGQSSLWALASGTGSKHKAGKIRSYVPSIIVLDESEFQDNAAEVLRAVLPLWDEGKRVQVVMLSSSNGARGPLAEECAAAGFTRWR
jgi:hypothetical protein